MPKLPTEERPAKQPAPRTCKRCGQPINTQTDSWEMKTGDDGKYAVGIQHVTCPPSPETSGPMPQPPRMYPSLTGRGRRSRAGGGGHRLPVFLTMDEAAALLRVSKATIRRRIRDGELPAKRLRGGQTVLIEQAHVLALLEDITPGTDV